MPPFKDGHQIHLLEGSEHYFAALVRAMDAARYEIRLETYIFDVTAGGQDIANSLIRAASRGVAVFVLMDGAGTPALPAPWPTRFDAAGVHWHIYNTLGPLGLLIPSRWRRLHRKLCVVDGGTEHAVGFCGGINILDDYHDPNHGALAKPRFDFAVQVDGPLVDLMSDTTAALWQRQRAFRQFRQNPLRTTLNTTLSTLASAREKLARTAAPVPPASQASAANAHFARAALLLRDNLRNRNRIEKSYLKAIDEAQQEIIIANAYFLPGAKLRRALLGAARRGVKVRLLLQGRYEYFMQYHAARPVYQALLEAGIDIHEYAVSFLHAKVAVIDAYSAKAWATVGSSNLDPLSMLLAREANVVVLDPPFARELRQRLILAMQQDGTQVMLSDFTRRPWHQRLLDWIALGLMRLALAITGRRY
jgi:cardiolipin synthase A/B